MTKKTEWQIKADKEQAMREKGLAGLTAEQLNTIKEAEKTMLGVPGPKPQIHVDPLVFSVSV